jgi:PIN domain nuclease of toxin-antitoxin system
MARNGKITMTFQTDTRVRDEVAEIQEELGISMSEVIRRAVESFVNHRFQSAMSRFEMRLFEHAGTLDLQNDEVPRVASNLAARLTTAELERAADQATVPDRMFIAWVESELESRISTESRDGTSQVPSN